MTAIALSRATLDHVRAPVRTPGFNLAAVSPGIVHLGLGGFHRAHLARYMHRLMERRADALGWGILGAGLLPGDERMIQSLAPQDGLYALVERSFDDEVVTVIGSLAGVMFAGADTTALLDAIDRPGVRIVSLTVTEHGYCLTRATKRLDLDHALIRADRAHPQRPSSAVGVIVEAARRRRDGGGRPFTALSCDNIEHNGTVLRDAVLTLAQARDPALADWIGAEIAFPSTMVDRITPRTEQHDVALLAERHGLADRWPVFCETFTQFVVEDRFAAGRPALEEVGVQFTGDVAPYEFMKLRLLNASHLAVSGMGGLMGFTTIHEAMAEPLITRFMVALMERETGPTLHPVPGIDLDAYQRTLVQRFANPAIRDQVARVNTDAPLNVLLDPIRDRLERGWEIELLALALAAWLRRVRGEDESGARVEVRHPLAAELRARAIEGGADPAPLLSIGELFGTSGRDRRLAEPVQRWLASLYEVGSRETLRRAAARLEF